MTEEPETSAPIATALEQAFAEHLAPSKILQRILLTKLKEAGVRLTSREKENLQKASDEFFRTNDVSAIRNFNFSRKRKKNISIAIDASDIENAKKKNLKLIRSAVPRLIRSAAKILQQEYFDDMDRNRAAHYAQMAKFRSIVARSYGSAFRALSLFLVACMDANDRFLRELSTKNGLRRTAKRIALTRLHHRACRIATEIETLIHAGLGDGAMARWRTLYEICVFAVFIAESANPVARRFLDHEQVDRARITRLSKRLAGEDPKEMDDVIASLKTTYGKSFTEDCGWASKALGKDRVKFSDLEEATEFGHSRIHYLRANNAVHASALALYYRPSLDALTLPGDPMEWAIAGIRGLSSPALLCAWSLLNTSIALLNSNATADNVALILMLEKAKRRVDKEFSRVSNRIEARYGNGP